MRIPFLVQLAEWFLLRPDLKAGKLARLATSGKAKQRASGCMQIDELPSKLHSMLETTLGKTIVGA